MPTVNKTSKARPWQNKRKPFERSKEKDNSVLYNSSQWRKYSKSFRFDNPLCVMCLEKGLAIDSEVTDHIVPINENGSIWDLSNLQALCKVCHNKKSIEESKRAMRRY